VSLAGVPVPWAVAAALTEELAALSHGERRVLEGAAVAGDPFEPELAATAAGVSEPDAMAALDELLRRDLIQATDVPRRFRFRHPLVRGAVYDAAPGGWRLGAHERSAAALAARGAPAIERAHHVERSARHGDAAAIAVLRQAGEEVVARAPAGAARWFAAALRLLPETAPPEERVALLTARAGAEAATGQFREAHSALLESLELLPGESLPLRFRLTAACAGVEYFLGRHESAHARLAAALDDLPDTASPEAVALMLELARDGSLRGGYDRMRDWAARALTAARALGDRPLMAAAAGFLALAGAFMGSTAEADAARSEGAELLSAMRDEELALRLDAAAGLASAELYLDRFEAASAHAERGLAVARATGQGDALPAFLPILGTIALMRGRLSDAAELMDAAIEAARLSGNDQVLAWNLYTRSFGAAAAGDVETALATAEESVELLGALQHSLPAAWAGAALAGAVLLAGDPARAEQVLVNAGGGEELALFPGGWRTNFLELLTRCRLALGRHDEAARAAACTAARAEEVGLPMSAAMADRALAAVALNGGDAAKAAERALASAAAADAAGAPVEAAASRELAGRALAQQGELERAGAELRQAAAAFEECVALPRRDAAERELQRLGHRRLHRRTRAGKRDGTGVELLTARELQVARLIVDRKTNPQIASELFLSRKTVETHVRNLFAKLDVSSRVEVARAVERADREAAAR
jgi:DNA-binding NarL/FixJ family response regulator